MRAKTKLKETKVEKWLLEVEKWKGEIDRRAQIVYKVKKVFESASASADQLEEAQKLLQDPNNRWLTTGNSMRVICLNYLSSSAVSNLIRFFVFDTRFFFFITRVSYLDFLSDHPYDVSRRKKAANAVPA